MEPSITILGSAAAEGIPAMFCGCPLCRKAAELGGKDHRYRTAYKVNDRVRIDFGPDTLAQEYKFHLHSERLRHLFITHPHEDHLYCNLLFYRMPGFSAVPDGNLLTIYGSRGTIAEIMQALWSTNGFNGDLNRYKLKTVIFDYFEVIKPEGEDMEVIPLPASHYFDRPYIQPAIYVIRSGEKWILIANDTGDFPDPTWKFLKEQEFHFDIVICDCTYGTRSLKSGHMGGEAVLEVKDRLEKMGSITKETKFVVNHFTHNAQCTHEDLQNYFNPHGIFVGYDGMEL